MARKHHSQVTGAPVRAKSAEIKKAAPGAGLTRVEKDVAENYAAGGKSWRQAVREVHPDFDDMPYEKQRREVHRLQVKCLPYIKSLVEATRESAILERGELIDAARENLARATQQNDVAGINATIALLHKLGGFKDETKPKESESLAASDAVRLLEAVERLADRRAGGTSIDITPEKSRED